MCLNKKIINTLLCFVLIVLICGFIFFIFKIEKTKEKLSNSNIGLVAENKILEVPDRIIYKNQEGKYFIFDSDTSKCTKIYSELYSRTTSYIDGKVYTEQEISEMQSRGSFIEFDYNKKSKNYVFMLEEDGIGIIKRFSDSGQVIKRSLDDTASLIKKINKLTKDMKKYDFNKEYNYISENKLTEISKDLGFSQVRVGVYQEIIIYGSDNYKEILDKLNFKTDKKITNVNFDDQTIIITLSQYEIKNVTQNIGNIKYEFGEFLDEYTVNFLVVSKVVNTNCIYYNITDLSEYTTIKNSTTTNKDDYAVDYCIENSKYYAITDKEKIEIISVEKACDIADIEAKNEKYQYQSWNSEFYTRGRTKNDYISAELISDLSDISKLYHWNEGWKNSQYNGKLMWKVRLFDENDSLTSLYIYIDAINGQVIGAGASSD